MTIVNDKNFNSVVIAPAKPFALLFVSDTCPHCRTVEHVIDNIEKKNITPEIMTFVVNSSDSRRIMEKYMIRSFPTMFFFGSDMKNKHTVIGAQPYATFIDGYEKIGPKEKEPSKSFFTIIKEAFTKI